MPILNKWSYGYIHDIQINSMPARLPGCPAARLPGCPQFELNSPWRSSNHKGYNCQPDPSKRRSEDMRFRLYVLVYKKTHKPKLMGFSVGQTLIISFQILSLASLVSPTIKTRQTGYHRG